MCVCVCVCVCVYVKYDLNVYWKVAQKKYSNLLERKDVHPSLVLSNQIMFQTTCAPLQRKGKGGVKSITYPLGSN